jgi:hypothetical protein
MGKADPKKVLQMKPKKKCCKSKPRCARCPFVVFKVQKAHDSGARGKDLQKALKKARAA